MISYQITDCTCNCSAETFPAVPYWGRCRICRATPRPVYGARFETYVPLTQFAYRGPAELILKVSGRSAA